MLAWLFWCNIVCGQKCGQKREHKTGHNSSSWPPFEIKSSALDRIFHAGSNGNSFKAWNVQNNDEESRFKARNVQQKRRRKSGPTKKIGLEKMKKNTPCFDPLERRGIVDLVWVATGDGVQLVLKRWVINKKQFSHMKQFPKIVITRSPDHPQAWFWVQNELFCRGKFF